MRCVCFLYIYNISVLLSSILLFLVWMEAVRVLVDAEFM